MTKLLDIIKTYAIFAACFIIYIAYIKLIYSEFFLTRIFPFILAWWLVEKIKDFMAKKNNRT